MQIPTRRLLPCLGALFALALILAAPARLRAADPAGSTVDPATVVARQVFNDAASQAINTDVYSTDIATDASGNYFVLETSNVRYNNGNGNSGQYAPNTTLAKYDANGTLLWRRSRAVQEVDVTGVPPTYYESFGDGQSLPIDQARFRATYSGAFLAVDADGAVTMACGTTRPPYYSEGGTYSYATPIAFVKFKADGTFLHDDYLTPTNIPQLGNASFNYFKAIQNLPDGSLVALVIQANSSLYGNLVVKLDANGGVVFALNYGGYGTDNPSTYNSTPLSISADSAGNLYFVSNDGPSYYYNQTPTQEPLQSENVIRKFDPQGNLLGIVRSNVNLPGDHYPSDAWNDAQAAADGSIYVAGVHGQSASNYYTNDGVSQQLVLKYDASLALVWRVVGPNEADTSLSTSGPVSVANLRLSTSGITVGGNIGNSYVGSTSWEVARYAYADGSALWHAVYNSGISNTNGGGSNTALGIIRLDSKENVFVGGIVPRDGTGYIDTALGKFDASGNLQFVKVVPAGDPSTSPATTESFQAISLRLFANDRPLFFGQAYNQTVESVVAVDFNNPADVTPTPTPTPTPDPTPDPTPTPGPSPTPPVFGTFTSSTTATATVGTAFSYQITVSGFTPTNYYVFNDLPDGLSLNGFTGLISGVPTSAAAGAQDIYLYVYSPSSNYSYVYATLTLTVNPAGTVTPTPTPTPGPTPTPTPPGVTPTPTPTPTPTSSPTPAAGSDDLSITTSVLPSPLVQNALATYHVVVTNRGPATATGVKVTVSFGAGLTFVAQGSVSGVTQLRDTFLSLPLADLAPGGTGASTSFDLVFRVTAGGGATVSCSTSVSGDQSDANIFDNNDDLLSTVTGGTPAAHAPTLNAPAGGTITIGQAFAYQITTLGDVAVDRFGATGLPAGLAIDANSGLISGTATADATPGAAGVTLSASNGAGRSTSTRTFTVVAAVTGKTSDVSATLGGLKVTKPAGDATAGKYVFKGSVTIANAGRKPARKLAVGLYLSNSPFFSFPAVADDPSISQVAVYLDTSNPLKPALALTPAGGTALTAVLPITLAKKGDPLSSLGPVPFKLKLAARRVNTAAAKYRYLLVVLDPANAIKESNKANNVSAIDLQAATH